VSYTSDHSTGPNDETYTMVTAHFIDTNVWEMRSMCLDFKVFSGGTTGENIYNDIQSVLQKFRVVSSTLFRIQLGLQTPLETWADWAHSCKKLAMSMRIALIMCFI
jgi:hypothetical protein